MRVRYRSILCVGAILAVLAASNGCGTSPEPTPTPIPETGAAPPLGQVVIIGLDGADWQIIDPLVAAGGMPNVKRLRDEGAWGVLRSQQPLLSPIVWTTIATGRDPLDHGILGFLTMRDGKTEPVRSDERRKPAFWNLSHELGFTTGVIGWYASWPADPVNGFLVSDRVGYHQVTGTADRVNDGLVYPESLSAEIGDIWAQVQAAVSTRSAARFFTAGQAGGASVSIDQEKLDTFVGVLRTTELYRTIAPMLLDRDEPDLAAIYFEGTDSVGHLFGEYAPPLLPGVDPTKARHLGSAFGRFYEYIDTVIGEIVDGLDPDRTTLMLVSDHGFKSGDMRPRIKTRTAHSDQAPLWHRDEGVLLMWGRGVRRGIELGESSIVDVLPTALRALGAPIAASLEGRVVEEAFTPDLLAHRVPPVNDYDAFAPTASASEIPAADGDDVLAKLRALGYVGGEGDSIEGPAGEEGHLAVPLNRYNMGLILLDRGRHAEAIDVFRDLQRTAPRFALGFLGEGMALMEQGRFEQAAERLEAGLELGSLAPLHATLGEAYQQLGRTGDAARELMQANAMDSGDGHTALLLAESRLAAGDVAGARPLFDQALASARSPADRAAACIGLAIAAEERRDLQAAADLYEQSLELAPDNPRALERYGNLELYRGRIEHGVELLATLVDTVGGAGRARLLHGRALMLAGREDEARAALGLAAEADPTLAEGRELLRDLDRDRH